MRIVGGTRKGARLVAPRGARTRPTSDRAREAIFQLVGSVTGARVLDLFAGSGALGLEALSRGAASAVLVDSDPAAVQAIERNIDKLALDGARVLRVAAARFLSSTSETFDLVFVDPPYEMVESQRMRLASQLPRALAPQATVVYESAAGTVPLLPLAQRTTRRYGAAQVSIFTAGEGLGDGG